MKRLDWKRLLGFEQVVEQREALAERSNFAKVGGKVGGKDGFKGRRIGSKIGNKEGLKGR